MLSSSTRPPPPLIKWQRRFIGFTRAAMHAAAITLPLPTNTSATTAAATLAHNKWIRTVVAIMLIGMSGWAWITWTGTAATEEPSWLDRFDTHARVDTDASLFLTDDTSILSLDPFPLASLRHLVLVAGHAVLTSSDVHDIASPDNWSLLEYQRGQVSTYIAHIRRGVEIAREDQSALLVFSGGETRAKAGPRSEAQSYWTAADHAHWFAAASASSSTNVSDRAVTEEYARDSFENLMFSICRFREVTGHYPTHITVVGFSFKSARFRTLHRAALRWPDDRFDYEGIDPPDMESENESQRSQEEDSTATKSIQSRKRGDSSKRSQTAATGTTSASRAALLASEQSQSFLPFQLDPYSCHAPLLLKKRARNPFRRSHAGYIVGCPEMASLLRYCKRNIFEGPLPWDDIDEQQQE